MGGLWGWPKTHRGFEPSVYFHSDEIFLCGFKGIGAEYLMNCVTLSFPHICLSLPAAMLGSSFAFAWYECFLPACASTSWYFWLSAELPWSCLSGLMQGGFVFLGVFLVFLGYVAPWASASPVPGWAVLRSVGSWVFQCSLWFYLPVRERKCSPWVWPRAEGAFFSMTTVNCH